MFQIGPRPRRPFHGILLFHSGSISPAFPPLVLAFHHVGLAVFGSLHPLSTRLKQQQEMDGDAMKLGFS